MMSTKTSLFVNLNTEIQINLVIIIAFHDDFIKYKTLQKYVKCFSSLSDNVIKWVIE